MYKVSNWRLVKKENGYFIENRGGITFPYDPNKGVRLIEKDGFAFPDANGNGILDAFEDWRLPVTLRFADYLQKMKKEKQLLIREI